ncbi:MAG: molybdenum cofactor guanylyltransferase [Proteobacteria bacterium]|nr:molybdenum cofactor guanylyltransferase [Pseudomonadota bacterium]
MEKEPQISVTGLLLAGGRARRMGGNDKGLLPLNGRPLAAWGLERLAPQVDELLISANRNQAQYEKLGASVISDSIDGFVGPLAGFVAGLQQARNQWVVTAPCDSPFLAEDYVERMIATMSKQSVDAVVAHDGNRLQPVFILINCRLREGLFQFLESDQRKIDLWLDQTNWCMTDFSDCPDMFLNANTPEELELMHQTLLATLAENN